VWQVLWDSFLNAPLKVWEAIVLLGIPVAIILEGMRVKLNAVERGVRAILMRMEAQPLLLAPPRREPYSCSRSNRIATQHARFRRLKWWFRGGRSRRRVARLDHPPHELRQCSPSIGSPRWGGRARSGSLCGDVVA